MCQYGRARDGRGREWVGGGGWDGGWRGAYPPETTKVLPSTFMVVLVGWVEGIGMLELAD